MQEFNRYRASKCPIHDGDNPTALTFYPNDEPYGSWQCNTKGCHKHFVRNAIGFIRGVLSARKGWNHLNKQKVGFNEAVEICKGLVGHVKLEDNGLLRSKLLSDIRVKKEVQGGIARDLIRSKLKIPSEYFLRPENGGFKPETLDMFDVGEPITPKAEMYGRVIIPIYDDKFRYIGCQGRHTGDNPIRWKNSEGLPLGDILYNMPYAKSKILETKEIILVEGPKAVWRLWEAGIRNVLAILGNFKSNQQIQLELTGASVIKCMMDNDDAGNSHFESIYKKCKRLFHVHKVEFGKPNDGKKDPADYTVEEIKSIFNIGG